MSGEGQQLHFVKHVHDREQIITKFECRGDEASPCHQYPRCECETAPCEHEPVPNAECRVQPWMDDVCAAECFDPREQVPARDGAIVEWWDGDCYSWDYAEPWAYDFPEPAREA